MRFDLSLQKTNFLKGMAILLILFSHLGIIRYGGNIGVSLFLVLSGYGLYYSFSKKGFKDFWKKRITKVFLPYWILTLLWLVIDYFLGISHPVKSSLLAFLGYQNTIDVTMWYIQYLLFWYIAFYLVFKIFKNKKIAIVLMFLISYFCFSLSIEGFFPQGGGPQYYSLMFPLGILLCELRSNKVLNNKYMLAPLLLLLFAFLYEYNNIYGNTPNFNHHLIMMHSITLLLILTISYFKVEMPENSVVIKFGIYSYFIYLIEGVLLNKYNFLQYILGSGLIYKISFIIIVFLMAVVLSKLNDKLIKFLKGGRK